MKRDVGWDALRVVDREGPGPLRVEADRHERDDDLLMSDAVLVPERKAAFAELGIPPDAMEKVFKRLHAAADDRTCTRRSRRVPS